MDLKRKMLDFIDNLSSALGKDYLPFIEACPHSQRNTEGSSLRLGCAIRIYEIFGFKPFSGRSLIRIMLKQMVFPFDESIGFQGASPFWEKLCESVSPIGTEPTDRHGRL